MELIKNITTRKRMIKIDNCKLTYKKGKKFLFYGIKNKVVLLYDKDTIKIKIDDYIYYSTYNKIIDNKESIIIRFKTFDFIAEKKNVSINNMISFNNFIDRIAF